MKQLVRFLALGLPCAALVYAAVPAAAETTLRIGTTAFPQARGNPFVGVSLPSTLPWSAVFDTLTRLDDQGRAAPGLALDWRTEDERTWVFTLREGVTFHNGEPLTAAAVVNAVRYLGSRDGQTRTLGALLRAVKRAEARDDRTVAITTDAPMPLLPLHLRQLRIPAPGAWRKLGPDDFAKAPVGSGPFAVTSWSEAEIAAVAYPPAWRKAKVDALRLRLIPDAAARAAALQSDALDVALFLSPEDKDAVGRIGGQLVARRDPTLWFATFVTAKDTPIKDPRVRVAMNLAVDRQKIIDAVLAGATEPATQFAVPGSFGYDPELTGFPYDPDRARLLLSDAGYYTGFDMVMTVVPGTAAETIYQLVAADLAQVGVRVELRPVPLAQFVAHMRDGSWPGAAYANGHTAIDPLETLRTTMCDAAGSFHCSREVMAVVDAARGLFDLAERASLARQVQALQLQDPPGLLLWQQVSFDGVGPRVTGFAVVNDAVRFEEIGLR